MDVCTAWMWAMLLIFWRYVLPQSSGSKYSEYVSFCAYIDIYFKTKTGEMSTVWYPVLVNGNSELEKVSRERSSPYKDHCVHRNHQELMFQSSDPSNCSPGMTLGSSLGDDLFVHSMAFERADYFLSCTSHCPLSIGPDEAPTPTLPLHGSLKTYIRRNPPTLHRLNPENVGRMYL